MILHVYKLKINHFTHKDLNPKLPCISVVFGLRSLYQARQVHSIMGVEGKIIMMCASSLSFIASSGIVYMIGKSLKTSSSRPAGADAVSILFVRRLRLLPMLWGSGEMVQCMMVLPLFVACYLC